MRIGINGSTHIALGSPAATIVDHARQAEVDGFSSYWLAQLTAPDALTLLGVVGQATDTIELGTAVVPIWTRHPLMLAAQALTTAALAGGRLALGIGLEHAVSVEARLRIPFRRPAARMDEYLSVLLPALTERRVDFEGEMYSAIVDAMGGPPDVPTPSVLLAAMGPRMLAMAGGRAEGTVLWLSGPRAVAEQIRPQINAAAAVADRPTPRIVASVPVCVTDEPERVRGLIASVLAGYNELPSYRGVMDTEGAGGPADVSIVGDEDAVAAGIERFAEAGATDFAALELTTGDEEAARTRALLASIAERGAAPA